MKKFYYLISMLAVLSLGACQNEDDFASQEQKLSEVEVEATLENGANSRTSLSEGKVCWEENDALSVFLGNATGQKATIIEETMEDTYAQFKVSANSDVILGGGTEDDENSFVNVAYYPYGDNVTITKDGSNYVVSAVFPVTQNFKDGSFDTNVYPMVAVNDGLNFGFKNVAGMIHIPLKGTATITKVTVESKNHKLAGNYKVTASADAVPNMEMADDASSMITLNCGDEGVTLNESTAKGFDFVLPVGTYEGGDLTFKFYDKNNGSMEFVAANDDKVERSKRTVFSEKLYRSDLGYEKVSENEYNVWSAKGLFQFSDVQQKGVTLNIIDDIDFEDAEFKAIPVGYNASLTINGNNHTISNVKVVSGTNDNGTGQASMFYAYTGSTLNVSDLKIDNIQVTGDEDDSGYAAAVVGYAEGAVTMDNVDVTNAAITGAKSSGMLVGHLATTGSLVAKNCEVSGTITLTDYESGGHYAGEYIGTVQSLANLTSCTANVTISGNVKDTNFGTIYGRIVDASLKVDGAQVVNSSSMLTAAIAASNSTILLADGTYEGCFDIKDKSNITLQALNKDKAEIKGLVYVTGSNVKLQSLKLSNPSAVKTSSCTTGDLIDKHVNGNKPIVGVYVNSTVDLEKCTFDLSGDVTYGFYAYASTNATFTNCVFECGKKRPIASNGEKTTVTGCTFNNQYHYSLRLFENSGNKQTVVFTNNTIKGSNDKGEFEGINFSRKGTPATILGDFTIKGNTAGLKYRYHKEATMSTSCKYDTDIENFAFEQEQ